MCMFGGSPSYAAPPPPQIPDYSVATREQQAQQAQQTANASRARVAMTQGPSSLINSQTGFNGVPSGSNNLGSA